MLELRDIVLQRGKKVLLDHASARIGDNQRVGLIGRNGAGKSSLMSVLMGELQEDGGHYHCDVPAKRIAYLEQSLPDSRFSILEFVKSGDREWLEVQSQLRQAEVAQDGVAVAECHARLHDIDGYTIDARAARVLHGLGFSQADLDKSVGAFSGGWQMRLQLAKVLLSRADLFLLDEPTNHLDLEAIAWLEQWLLSQNTSMILISHDRDFLDHVCTQILHLAQQKLTLYSGNYTEFIKQFELQLEIQARQSEKMLKQKAHMQKFVDRFRYKASKARQAQSRLKAIEKLTVAPGVQQENPFHFSFLPCQLLSSPVLKLEGDVGYPQACILQQVDLSITAEDRIGLIGVNGAGKSTLIKTLSDELPLLSGERVSHAKLNIGYFSQQQLDALDYDSTPLAHMLKHYPHIAESEARRFLGGFNITGDRVFDAVRLFSGGEKARLALALLIYKAPNLLLLDEPTNHLDIQMREALILALQEYEGAVIVISHDRYFMNSIVDRLWRVAEGCVSQFKGNLDDYQQLMLTAVDAATEKPIQSTKTTKVHKKTSNKSANPQKLKKLEQQIDRLTHEKQDITSQLSNSQLYTAEHAARLQQLQTQLAAISDELLAAEEAWLELMRSFDC